MQSQSSPPQSKRDMLYEIYLDRFLERRKTEIDNEIELLSQKSTSTEEEIELSLELMERMQNQWITLDFSKKAEILGILTKEISLGKDGKDKPLITWELPWAALYEIGRSSKLGEWHARRDLNPRPLDSKSTALSAELRAHHVISYSF